MDYFYKLLYDTFEGEKCIIVPYKNISKSISIKGVVNMSTTYIHDAFEQEALILLNSLPSHDLMTKCIKHILEGKNYE